MNNTIRWLKTHCGRMDHGGCALLVGVKDNQIVNIKGDPDGFLNRGYICSKGLASPERLNHSQRLRKPLKRTGKRGSGKWQSISWQQALRIISDQFIKIKQKFGARSVVFGQGMPKGLEHFVLIRLANLFGSPNVVAVQDVCHAPREVSGLHTCGFYPVVDFDHASQLILLWGSNPMATNEEGAICRLVLDKLKAGSRLVVIDPKETELAEQADLWLPIRPGADSALALAMLHVIIEEKLYDNDFVSNWTHGFHDLAQQIKTYSPEKMAVHTWLSPEQIRQCARQYAAAQPAAIHWGNPLEQTNNTFHTVRAILCLMALCGNLDIAGGNVQAAEPQILGLGSFVRADLIPNKRFEMIHAHHNTIPKMMTVPPAYLRSAILKEIPYPVKGAFFQGANPLLGYADSRQTDAALQKLDFLVVSDIVMTPTAALADIVLPAATHFEFNDIGHYGLGHGYILARPRVVSPPPECWPDMKILNELGKLISPGRYWFDNYEDLLELVLKPSGLSFDQFAHQGYLKGEQQYQKYLSSDFNTATGKVELVLSQAEKFNLPALPRFDGFANEPDSDYPLVLTSAKSPYYLHSSYRWLASLKKYRPRPVAEIHSATAAKYNIDSKDQIIIETKYGQISQQVHLTDRVRQGVVFADYGWWEGVQDQGCFFDWQSANYNMLTSTDLLGQEFGTPNLKGIPCRISKKNRD